MKIPEIKAIPLSQLVESRTNPRGALDKEAIQELADSISQEGLLQPILVRPKGKKFEVVAGARRFRATGLAGLEAIPCIVRDMDDEKMIEIQIIENLQRKDIHPLDEAAAYKSLSGKYSVQQIADKINKTPSYVHKRLKLNDLVPEARESFYKDVLGYSHAIELARLQEKDQKKAFGHIIRKYPAKHAGTVAELRHFIQNNCMLLISEAAFDTSNAQLVTAAGPCDLCPKRTGYNTTLFNDLGEADRCTDGACFNKKTSAHIAEVFERYKKKGKVYLGSLGWNETVTVNGQRHSIVKKSSSKTTLPVVIKSKERWITGHRLGAVVYIDPELIKGRTSASGNGASADQQERFKKEREKKEKRHRFERFLLDKILASDNKELSSQELRIYVDVNFREIDDDPLIMLMEHFGLIKGDGAKTAEDIYGAMSFSAQRKIEEQLIDTIAKDWALGKIVRVLNAVRSMGHYTAPNKEGDGLGAACTPLALDIKKLRSEFNKLEKSGAAKEIKT